jgi:hypothetical protein
VSEVEFVSGAAGLACAAVALFFFRFWRQSGDRLFAYFALAFAALAANRCVLLFVDPEDEVTTSAVYLIRLAAFVLIIVGIVEKNLAGRRAVR